MQLPFRVTQATKVQDYRTAEELLETIADITGIQHTNVTLGGFLKMLGFTPQSVRRSKTQVVRAWNCTISATTETLTPAQLESATDATFEPSGSNVEPSEQEELSEAELEQQWIVQQQKSALELKKRMGGL